MMALGKYWRINATFICFSIFAIGGILLSLIVRPILWVCIRSTSQRNRIGKSCIHYSFRGFVEMMQLLGVIKYTITGLEQFTSSGNLILANHPTLIDVVMLIAFIKNADCVVKGSLLNNPATCGPITMAGYIANDSPSKVIEQAALSLKQGNNVIIFPEGTRTTLNAALKLKRGAANIALTAKADITPVIIKCTPPALSKEQNWYEAANARVTISVSIQNTINIDTYAQQERTSHSSRQLTRYLEGYFSEALSLK
jgi:1-acyl-sn-glycerol-3-phosphate acyltransferase